MVSAYQSPYVKFAYTMRPNIVWNAQYNYYGYGEGGVSGATLCSTATSPTAVVTPCSNFAGLLGFGGIACGTCCGRRIYRTTELSC